MQLITILKNLGLNEKQAKVYLACLELGTAPAQRISEISNLPRSTCYEVLDSLKPLGFISSYQKRKIKWFTPSDPHALISTEKQKLHSLEKALPDFAAMYGNADSRPAVRFYQGQKALATILEEILAEAKELLAFGSSEDLINAFGEDWLEFVNRRVQNKIPSKVIARSSTLALERQQKGPGELRELRIIPEGTGIENHGMVLLWANKIAMMSFTTEVVGFIIESEELAKAQKSMFYLIWSRLPPYRARQI